MNKGGTHDKKTSFVDAIRGKIELQDNDVDVVILKSDGLPTYHFAHVCDDHFMHTTLVTRGEEWIPSTPIHLDMFKALGWEAPKYAHLPVIMDITSENVKEKLAGYDGILVPGGFGERGSEGKKIAIRYARENRVPFLGICFGLQLALVEYAQDVLGLKDANTTEFDPSTKSPVIDLLRDQYAGIKMGGTMRLGLYDCHIQKGTLAYKCYGETDIKERHRHRYEFNNQFKEAFEKSGLVFSGINPQAGLAEIIELPSHPFFIACQFHPEFTSRPLKPNPLFREFIAASIAYESHR